MTQGPSHGISYPVRGPAGDKVGDDFGPLPAETPHDRATALMDTLARSEPGLARPATQPDKKRLVSPGFVLGYVGALVGACALGAGVMVILINRVH